MLDCITFYLNKTGLAFSTATLLVGSRVMTPHGAGIVTGGCVHVDLDADTTLRRGNPHRVNIGAELDKVSVL